MADPKEFTPPASQEEFDRIIADRLARQKTQIEGQYADYADLKAKAAKFDEVDAASKTDLQRAQERAEAAERKANELEAAKKAETEKAAREKQVAEWAAEVGKAKNVPPALLLKAGGTKEEIEAYADELKPHVVAQKNDPVPNEGSRPSQATSEERAVVAQLFGTN